jgi:drug/metabolite transporter (DMT)-like permease
MLVAGLGFALMSVVVKQASATFSSHEMVFWRSALGMVFIAIFLHRPGRHDPAPGLGSPHLALLLRRGLAGLIALIAFFYSLAKLPMSVAVTLNYTSPLFLALLMPWWLRERPRLAQYAAVGLGFVGVFLLLRPWQAGGDVFAGLVGLFSGFMAAIAYVHVRQLGKLEEPEWRTVFWFAAVGVLGAGLLSSLTGWHRPGPEHVGLLLALGVFATLGQLAMTRAYRTGETVVVGALAYSTVVFSALLDGLIWNQDLSTTAWVGVFLTVAAGIAAVKFNQREPT